MKSAPSVPITVLMSVYNGERWLAESIQSVLNQTFSDFEFLIVDDGSSDGTAQILNEIAITDHRVRIIKKHNTGLADSLNCGIAEAKGVWIARQDADDVSEPGRLLKQWQAVQSMPSVVLTGSAFVLINDEGREGRRYRLPRSNTRLASWLSTGKRFFPHSSAFFNRDIVQRIGGYRQRIKRAQDRDLWLRLSEVGEIACIGEPLVKIRKHDDQISHDEGGQRQLIDSSVASASYWLRKYGLSDPVEGDEKSFLLFHSWVAATLADWRVFEMASERKLLTAEQLIWRRRLISILNEIMRGRVSMIRQVLWNRYFGNRLGKRLANHYIHQFKLDTHK